MESASEKKMVIITSFFKDETYGLLGPQMAATIIRDHTPYECIVIAVTRDFDKVALKNTLAEYFGKARLLIGFSSLSGREDLFDLAGELKDEGVVTILAGPQADVDFAGEEGWREHPHRFKGLSDNFTCGLHGPAEQVIGLLNRLGGNDWSQTPGLSFIDRDGNLIQTRANGWNEKYLAKVSWDNIYLTANDEIVSLNIGMGQVLQHIGCPHAARTTPMEIDYPVSLTRRQGYRIKLPLRGCSFCDVAADKGFHGKLDQEVMISQIRCLPKTRDGRRIPFELINENPLPILLDLLQAVNQLGMDISQINLTLRADWFVSGIQHLKEALEAAGELGVYVLLSSIGFESFDDTILSNLNKGLSVQKNIEAIHLIRQLKEEFPHQLGYSSREGANHGFIHPTPWDTKDTAAAIQKTISLYGLQNDILPPHSTPLIIHHASGLADWIRGIEQREGIYFNRYGSIIGWWDEPRPLRND
ncbi:MAG: hypothetical protein QNL14_08800 [Deltaproteobacteria bacterium]|nr:hypothetical protein [Deltaproteobacteria bacterium]